ncbi:MAG: sugar ABC transporter ATP-binding protein [Nitriliruptoraceae bacterium]|nr:sugar ABC transporter ATP-binding protein [Nitriliruptoraceae bacterium]
MTSPTEPNPTDADASLAADGVAGDRVAPSGAAPVLELADITKSFGANQVLKGVDMALRPGCVTALLGANGAGKSTLIKILSGVHPDHGGTVAVDGIVRPLGSPSEAADHGIQTVHQRIDESIVPGLTVAENLVFEELIRGQLPAVRSTSQLLPRAREIAATLDLPWSDAVLRTDVFEFGIADSQMLLLARALSREPKVLILDEPTSTLSASEADRLFALVRQLRDHGVAILYVSHRLSEVRSLADDLVVLRDGRVTQQQQRPFDMSAAVRAMLAEGTDAGTATTVDEVRGHDEALDLRGLRLLARAEPIDLSIRAGEVTGVLGLIGAGKSELARQIFGADKLPEGEMRLKGAPYRPDHPRDAVAAGVYLVPEDRAAEAMFPAWSVARTVTLPFLGRVSRSGVLRQFLERATGNRVIETYQVVAEGPAQSVDALSGGNQQKVVVGRWMDADPQVLLLDEPFRGVDIGARGELSRRVREQAADGACVVVFASDVEEIRGVADRIVVLVEGQIHLDAYTTEVDDDAIVTAMSEES